MTTTQKNQHNHWDTILSTPLMLWMLGGFLFLQLPVLYLCLKWAQSTEAVEGFHSFSNVATLIPGLFPPIVATFAAVLFSHRQPYLRIVRWMIFLQIACLGWFKIYRPLEYQISAGIENLNFGFPSLVGRLIVAAGMIPVWILWLVLLNSSPVRRWETQNLDSDSTASWEWSHRISRTLGGVCCMAIGSIPIFTIAGFSILMAQAPLPNRTLSFPQLAARMEMKDNWVLQARQVTYRYVYRNLLKGSHDGLIQLPPTSTIGYQRDAIQGLAHHGDHGVPILIEALSSPHETVRLEAANSLQKLGHPAASSALGIDQPLEEPFQTRVPAQDRL